MSNKNDSRNNTIDDETSEPEAKISKLESSLLHIGDHCQSQTQSNACSASVKLNECIFSHELVKKIHDNNLSRADYTDDSSGIKLSSDPFPHCIIPNMIVDDNYVKELESILLDLQMKTKNNDLYKFHQSGDLFNSSVPAIATFRLLCYSLKNFVSEITGISLNDKIDLFCSQYKYKDVLLCHDDELEGRRIAFIYYLVPESWHASDGGTLDLFNTDESGLPEDIVKSIVPVRNNFLFFQVSERSFHQVSEVLSKTKTRLSISGWFHGDPLERPPSYIEVLEPALPYGNVEEEIFFAWLNPLYLDPEVQVEIRSKFEEDSEIELTEFLQENKYKSLESALKDVKINWSLLGPPNKRHYYKADKTSFPPIVCEFLQVMHSDAAFLVMSTLTGLKLHPLAPTDEEESCPSTSVSTNAGSSCSRCKSEVCRWQHGCYTLVYDNDPDMEDYALDTMLYIGCKKNWDSDCGGYTSYIAKGEDEELLSVLPSGNSLALVYRDRSTMKFVKHLNHQISEISPSCFYEINTVYYE